MEKETGNITGSEDMKEFEIYSKGLCYTSVCSSLPRPEVEKRMRLELTGINHNWTLAKKKFRSGELNPCPCNENPKTHKHYLFEC